MESNFIMKKSELINILQALLILRSGLNSDGGGIGLIVTGYRFKEVQEKSIEVKTFFKLKLFCRLIKK